MIELRPEATATPRSAVAAHWAEASMEALGLGLFMVSAGCFATLLEAPGSPVHLAVPDTFLRRLLMGLAMGLTAVSLTYAPWGQRSGAHNNPAVTLTFFRLGRVSLADAVAYTAAQVIGGLGGVAVTALLLGDAFTGPPVRGVATTPGSGGAPVAFVAELAISFVLMSVVLAFGRSPRLGRFTGVAAGLLVCVFIVVEAPSSGMSMNPARTLASAIGAGQWEGLWIYLAAPVLGMLLAAEVHLRLLAPAGGCAKLYHRLPCVFCGAVTDPRRAP